MTRMFSGTSPQCFPRWAGRCGAIIFALLFASAGARADVVLEWNDLMLDAIRVDNSAPTVRSRNLAILHTAVYDSVNSILRTHQPYRFEQAAAPGTSVEAAAVGAAYEVTKVLYQTFAAPADELYTRWRAATPDTEATAQGLELGRQVAQLTLASRSADGSSTEVPYIPSDAPGQWRRTPPFFRPPLTPHWRFVTPFCLPGLEAFLPPPPPALDSAEYAQAVNEIKAMGGLGSTLRTAEQGLIARYWSDFSYTAMPPGHWHEIAATIARDRGNTLAENARLFALISLAQADAAILCWESKYAHNLWRPVTAIQRADEDGNPLTEADPGWEQYLPAPPFPAYPSGHSTFSKASAQVLTHFYGTDAISFTTSSDTVHGVFRSFDSLAACADEVGMSRIYGGFHFSFDNVHGKTAGARIGDYVSANFLLPHGGLPSLGVVAAQASLPKIRLHGLVGRAYVLEFTVDLEHWHAVSTNNAVVGGVIVADPGASDEGSRFYRVREHAP
jgi:hypothetical protein